MTLISGCIVVLFALYLISLGVFSFVIPDKLTSFFYQFASTAKAHYLEQLIRLIVGGSLLHASGTMLFSEVFDIAGSIILGTTALLILIPWKIHRKFASWAVPLVISHMKLYTGIGLLSGLFILYCCFQPLL